MCRRRCSTTLHYRALSKAPGATCPVPQWGISSTGVSADCQEIGCELVTCLQRGWKGAKPGLVTIQGPHFTISQQQSELLKVYQSVKERASGIQASCHEELGRRVKGLYFLSH